MPSSTSFLGALGARYPDSKLLFDDTFDNGFCGWDALMDTTTPRPALGLTTNHPFSGSHALSLGVGPVTGASKDGFGEAIKRTTRIHDTGVVNFDVWWSFGSTDWPNAPQSIEFGIDTQNRAGNVRTLPIWRWQIVNPSNGNTGYYTWGIESDVPAIVNIPNAIYGHPYNENKENTIYTRFRYDLTLGYQDLWVYDDHYDLTGLGAGTGNSSTVNNFNGGLNFFVAISNRSSTHLAQAWATIGRARAWYE